MQAAGISSSLVKQKAVLTDLSAGASGDFSATLRESISRAAPTARGKESGGKKVAGKSDPKIQPDAPAAAPDKQTSGAAVTTANPLLPIQLSVNPLGLADLTFALPQKVAGTIEKSPGSESALSGRASTARASTGTATTSSPLPIGPNSLSVTTSVATLTPANPLPGAKNASSEIALEGLKSALREVVGLSSTEKNDPITRADRESAGAGGGAREAVAQPLIAPAKVTLPCGDPLVAAQATVSQPTGAILQRQAVDIYKGTSAAEQATPKSINQIVLQPVPDHVAVHVSETLHVPETVSSASARVLPQIVAATGANSEARIASRDAQQTAEPPAPEARPLFVGTSTVALPSPSTNRSEAAISPTADPALPPATEGAAAGRSEKKSANSAVETEPSPTFVLLSSDGPAPTQAIQAATGAEKTTGVTPGSTTDNPSCAASNSVPEVPEPAPAEEVRVAAGASIPAQLKTPEAESDKRPNKIKAVASTPIANEIRAAASHAAQAHGQLFPESPSGNKTLGPVRIEAAVESKDAPERKAPAPSSQGPPSSHDAQVSLIRDDGVAAVVPREAASVAPPHASSSSETREAPKTPTPPDPTPAAGSALAAARIATDVGGDVQMHVGIRTAAFGAVEIYTSVHQNQVGIAVHGERGMAHWFSSEVQNLEFGLKDHHLHLTTVEMDKGGTGLQTSTGSQQQNPHRNFQATRGWQNQRIEQREKAELIEAVPVGLPAWSGENRVSIHI